MIARDVTPEATSVEGRLAALLSAVETLVEINAQQAIWTQRLFLIVALESDRAHKMHSAIRELAKEMLDGETGDALIQELAENLLGDDDEESEDEDDESGEDVLDRR